jgi:hypothetical protein
MRPSIAMFHWIDDCEGGGPWKLYYTQGSWDVSQIIFGFVLIDCGVNHRSCSDSYSVIGQKR